MSNGNLLTIDVGATVVRASVYDLEGRCLAIRDRAVDLKHPQPGQVEVNATAYYDAAAMVARRALRAAGDAGASIQAIALSSQMGGIVGVDETFKPVTRFDVHLDERCQPIREQVMRQHESTLRELTGCLPYLGVKIKWWQDNEPNEAAQVRKWVTLGGYLAGRMAGLNADEAFIDHTQLGLSGLADNAAGAWSDILLGIFGVSRDVLPRIVRPSEVIGRLSDVTAPDFRLSAGIPIVAGLSDHVATFLGSGLTRPGRLCDMSGQICHFAAATDHFAADVRHRALSTLAGPTEGLWYAMAYVNAGGITCRWFLQDVFNHPKEDDKLPARIRLLEEEASRLSPGADGLLFLPHLAGRQCPWDPAIRGSWLGMQPQHTQKHFHRSILESVAFEYAYFLLVVREMFNQTTFDEIHGIGGGSRSRLWSQIKADVLGLPYVIPTREDQAMVGAAATAAAGINAVPGVVDAIERWIVPGDRLMPDRDRHREYAALFQIYIRALTELRPLFADLRNLARRPAAVLSAPPGAQHTIQAPPTQPA
jgi:xylulokinase